MGHAILYCVTCSTRILEEDFALGKAYRVGDHVLCAACAPESARTAPAPEPQKKSRTTTKVRAPLAAPPAAPPLPPLRPGKKWLVGALVALAGLGVVIAWAALSGGKERPERSEAEGSQLPGARGPRREVLSPSAAPGGRSPAEQALETARAFGRAQPADLKGRIRELDRVAWDFEATSSGREAKKEAAGLRQALRESLVPELEAILTKARSCQGRESFGEALRILEEGKSRHDGPEWTQPLSRQEEQIQKQAQELLGELRSRVAHALSLNWTQEAEKIASRVRAWGLASAQKELEDMLGTSRPSPESSSAARPLSEEGRRYLAAWESALGRATARDYALAVQELLQLRAGLKEDGPVRELGDDVEDLRRVETLYQESIGLAGKRRLGSYLEIETRDGKKCSGRILFVDPDRVELEGDPKKPSTFVEWRQATPGSITAIPRAQKPDPRTIALFCLLEGDIPGARSILGGKDDSVPPKYWSYAEKAPARLSIPDPKEQAARELYYEAERLYHAMETRGPAAEKYRRLKAEYSTIALVKKLGSRIAERSEAPKEYLLAGQDYRCSGSLRRAKSGRIESKADSGDSQVLQNFAELEFYAFPGATYRCWVFLGGCCSEVFTFYLQGTELTENHPKTHQRTALEPGSNRVATVKPILKGLKASHPPKEPKTATRWEWIELSLPKYTQPGLKRIRLLTDQAGFSIGPALVSQVRTKPPNEQEAREIEAKRAEENPVRPSDPDLLAYWKFDEEEGPIALDSSGNGHDATLKDGAAWAGGPAGGGVRLNGLGAHVAAPNSPDLDRVQDSSYTLVAWFKPEAVPPGTGEANDAAYGIVEKVGWHSGLCYTHDQRFRMEHWNQDRDELAGTFDRVSPPGRFYQVAGVADRSERCTKIYLDGRLGGTTLWAGDAPTRSYGTVPWLIGIAHPRAAGYSWPALGVIRGVRIYRRALAAAEIENLYQEGQ